MAVETRVAPKLLRTQAYVDGAWVDADAGETFPVVNPATGETIAGVPRMGAAETRRAIAAATRAFPRWSGLLAKERSKILRRFAELMGENREDLAVLMTLEQGKPLAESRAEIDYAASFFEWFGEEAKRVYGDTIPAPLPDRRILVLKQPVGVTVGITPWNFPAATITRKAAPAPLRVARWSSSRRARPRSPRSRSQSSASERASRRECSASLPAAPKRSAAR